MNPPQKRMTKKENLVNLHSDDQISIGKARTRSKSNPSQTPQAINIPDKKHDRSKLKRQPTVWE